MCFLVNSNQWEGSAPRLLRGGSKSRFFSGDRIFKRGGGGERERDGNDGSANFSLAGSGVCSRPVEKFSEFVHEREPEKRQWDRD